MHRLRICITHMCNIDIYVCAYIYNGILLGHQKEWNKASCSDMDATTDYHTKWRRPDRGRQTPHDATCMWNPNTTQINLSTQQKRSHTEDKPVDSKKGGTGGGMQWKAGASGCKLYMQNGQVTKSHCRVTEATFNVLWWTIWKRVFTRECVCVCVCDWITLLDRRN